MTPAEMQIFYHPKDRLRLSLSDRSYPTVKPVWASPLSHPNRFLALLDEKGQEIAMVEDPSQLSETSRAAVEAELHKRYLTATVRAVTGAKVEFGATYWHVLTDRGERDFVTESLQENVQWLSERHLLLIDVDGNRFEIPDTEALDPRSRTFLAAIL